MGSFSEITNPWKNIERKIRFYESYVCWKNISGKTGTTVLKDQGIRTSLTPFQRHIWPTQEFTQLLTQIFSSSFSYSFTSWDPFCFLVLLLALKSLRLKFQIGGGRILFNKKVVAQTKTPNKWNHSMLKSMKIFAGKWCLMLYGFLFVATSAIGNICFANMSKDKMAWLKYCFWA